MNYRYYSILKDDGLYRFIVRIDKNGGIETMNANPSPMYGNPHPIIWIPEMYYNQSNMEHFKELHPLSGVKYSFRYLGWNKAWDHIVREETLKSSKLGSLIL